MRGSEKGPSWGQIRLAAIAATLALLALTLPAQASAAEHSLDLSIAGTGEGGLGCKVNAGPLEECEAEYEAGTELALFAEPELGSEFTGFSAGTGSASACTTSPCTITLNADSALTATFDLEEFELTVTTDGTGEGIVQCQAGAEPYEPCPASETYPYGTEVTLYAEPEEGSEFLQWGGECSGVEVECEVTVEEDLAVTATFKPEPPFSLTVETGGSGEGDVQCEVESEPAEACDPEAEYDEGTAITVIAEPETGSELTEWSGDCDSVSGNECELEMDADKTVEAVFDLEVTPEFELEISIDGTGSGEVECEVEGGEAETCEAEYEEGTEVALVPIADPESEFTGWSEDCTGTGACEVTMDEDHSVTATFDEEEPTVEEFNLTIAKTGTGSGTVKSTPAGIDCGTECQAPYEEGEEVTLTATAASGSTFSGWSGGGCSGTGTCKVTIDEDIGVTATFAAKEEAKKEEPKKEEPKPAPTPEGKAKAAATATVKSGKASLKLSCTGGPCKGTIQLKAKVKQGKKTKNLVIGKASFSIAEGASVTVKVKLSGPAKQELAKGRMLKAKTSGAGVTASTVKLKPQKK